MALVDIRKIVVTVESVRHDGGPPVESPLHAGTIFAVVKNPYAGPVSYTHLRAHET